MMLIICKRILLLLSLFLLYNIETPAQQQNCTGKMLNAKEGKIDAVCFLRIPNPIGNKTKYTILFNGVEIYEVEFTYYKEDDSILIQFFDKQNTTVKRETIRLNPEDSHFLICNYMPNTEYIDDNKSLYPILFGIDNPNRQFITLYQFQAIGGVQTQFILQNVPQVVLAAHATAVIDYKRIIAIRKQHDSSVSLLKNNMVNYKDSTLKSIKSTEILMQLQDATLKADTSLQKELTKQLDSIFINYFKNIYSFANDDFDVEFTFNCNGYGNIKIDSIKTMFFKGGASQKNWMKDSFMLIIKPLIEKNVFATLLSTDTHLNLKRDFLNWFQKGLRSYNLEADSSLFLETQKQIAVDLDEYTTRTINLPTKYSYSFKYKSVVKETIWKYNDKGNDKTFKSSDKNETVDESLKNIFIEKYASGGSGKYNIRICTVYINNIPMGADIQANKIK